MHDALQDVFGEMACLLSDLDGLLGDGNHEARAWAAAADAEVIRLLGLVVRRQPIQADDLLPFRLALECVAAAVRREQTIESDSLN